MLKRETSKLFFALTILLLLSFKCGTGDNNSGGPLPPISPDLPPPDVNRICIIGDGGTGGADQYSVSYYLTAEGCESVLYAGDVIYESGLKSDTDSQFEKKFYEPYKQMIEDHNATFYMSMGNHDWGNSVSPIDVWKKLAEKHAPSIVYDEYVYIKRIGDVCVLQLDTNNRKLFVSEMGWFNGIKNSDFWNGCKFTIAFGHHPYWSSGEHGDADSYVKSLLETMVIGHFDLYACGHDHQQSDESELNETKLLISGSAGKIRSLAGKPRGGWGVGKRGYLVLDIKDNIADFKFNIVENGKKTIPHRGQIIGKGFRK